MHACTEAVSVLYIPLNVVDVADGDGGGMEGVVVGVDSVGETLMSAVGVVFVLTLVLS